MLGKDIVATIEPGDHTKDGHLPEMEEGVNWQTAGQEPNDTFRGRGVELQQLLHVLLEVAGDDSNLWVGENHGCEAREKNRYAIQPLNSDTGSWVAAVTPGKTG